MSPVNTLRLTIRGLETAEVPYMLVGSGAAFIYGHDRTTQDFDILIDPTHEALDAFLVELQSSDVYVGPSPHQALDLRDQFNLVDYSSGWKIDLIVSNDRAFDRSRFDRRRRNVLLGIDVWVASPEDVALAKLEWHKMGESARQFDDVVTLLEVKAGELDEEYLDRWAEELGIRELLDRARAAMTQ